jgi:hypothetical protein
MARIRTIKPSFFTSLTIADLSIEARLTFIGLWTHCDDEGKCIYDPRLLKAALWPLDDRTASDVAGDIAAIVAAGLVTHYILTEDAVSPHAQGRTTAYLSVNGWTEHQRINRATESHLPNPADGAIMPPTRPNGPGGGLTEDALNGHHRNKEGNREGKGREGVRSAAPQRATARAAAPEPTQLPLPEQRIAKAVYDGTQGMVKYEAVMGVAKRALKVQGATVESVIRVMQGLYAEGKPLTLDLVGQRLGAGGGAGIRNQGFLGDRDADFGMPA